MDGRREFPTELCKESHELQAGLPYALCSSRTLEEWGPRNFHLPGASTLPLPDARGLEPLNSVPSFRRPQPRYSTNAPYASRF